MKINKPAKLITVNDIVSLTGMWVAIRLIRNDDGAVLLKPSEHFENYVDYPKYADKPVVFLETYNNVLTIAI